jgi:RNA polymerase sigma factor (sigma-70 family)
VEAAIRELPENQRVALTLRQYEQLDYEEIGRVMGLSVSSVKSLLFRARDRLREELKTYMGAT